MSRRLIVMGPSGSGKTTLGKALAGRLQMEFVDADDLHPPANVAKMKRGEPLNDTDREPWLARVAAMMAEHAAADRSVIIACSALRRAYRDRLRAADPQATFIFLDVPLAVLENRLRARPSHFMPPSLIASQIATLETPTPDEGALMLDATQPVADLVNRAVESIGA